MIDLYSISKIGCGTYRMSAKIKAHPDALRYAIDCGSNLLDTASNYENGDAELLIGDVVKTIDRHKIFIITKAGYISGRNFDVLESIKRSDGAYKEVCNISDQLKHSIHPDYLEAQVSESLRRLNTNYIDGYLLHSPEYYFQSQGITTSESAYYSRIAKAFEFLEDKVSKGTIRYYGVSSNTLVHARDSANATNFSKLLEIARKISLDNHFKLIQFPFNIAENKAILKDSEGNSSLVSEARENQVLTISNRSLNANINSSVLRLVLPDVSHTEYNEEKDRALRDHCFSIIDDQLKKMNAGVVKDFPVLELLNQNWNNLLHKQSFFKIFDHSFFPFVERIFNDDIPEKTMRVFLDFKAVCWKYHLKKVYESIAIFLESRGLERLLIGKSLPHAVCAQYLHEGIDHVLVGMRSKDYVNDLKDLF